MEVPFEDLPPVAQRRITALKEALVKSRPVDKQPLLDAFLERVQKQFPAFDFTGSPADMDAWVESQLHKDETWVMDMARILYDEGLETRKEALQAQLCSSIGKSLPEDFDFSQDEKAKAWAMALDSASAQAETFNAQLPKWIAKARADWVKEHGSLQGLNRYVLLKLVKRYVEDYFVWKDEQVAVTEFNAQWTDETAAFWIANAGEAEIECQILPETYSDPARDTDIPCILIANQWFSYDEAAALAFQHVNCPHHPAKSRIKEGSLPLFLAIGFSKHNREELPNC